MESPEPIDVDTHEGSVDLQDEDLFDMPLHPLDSVYLEDSMASANKLIDENLSWWMTTVSGYCTVINRIREILVLYEDCELKSELDGILQAVPDVSSPPPVPRILLPVSDTTPARKKAKADRDITAVYAEMVQNYRKDLPAANVTDDRLCPPTRKIPLSELPQQLDRCHEKFKVVENSNLLNGTIF